MSANLQSTCRRRTGSETELSGRAELDVYFTWAKHPELPHGIKPGIALALSVAGRPSRVNSPRVLRAGTHRGLWR